MSLSPLGRFTLPNKKPTLKSGYGPAHAGIAIDSAHLLHFKYCADAAQASYMLY